MSSSIVTLIAAAAAQRLGGDISPSRIISHARGVNEVVRALDVGAAGWFIVDPTLLRLDALNDVIERATRAGAGVLAELALSDAGVERLLQILLHHSVEVHLESNAPGRVRGQACLGRPPAVSLPSELLHALAPQLLRLPPPIRTLIVGVIAAAPDVRTTQELIDDCEVSRRSIDRWLRRTALTSLARVERVARVARSWELLTHEPMRLGALAARSGFGAERTLRDAWRATCGLSPRRAGLTLNAHDVLARLVASMEAIPIASRANVSSACG
jgi:AraC-like DNA-binding protein